MREVNGNLGLINKHGDIFWVSRNVRENAFDDHQALKAVGINRFGLEDLRHSTLGNQIEQNVLAEFLGMVCHGGADFVIASDRRERGDPDVTSI
jgi:hypothetical protein